MKQNKYCALGNADVAVRWAKAEVKPCQQCKASASFAHPTGPHGGRAQAASVFIAPHGRGKELEWRHTSSVKAVNQITGGTNGIRFQGQWQGGALRCPAEHPAVVGDPRGTPA